MISSFEYGQFPKFIRKEVGKDQYSINSRKMQQRLYYCIFEIITDLSKRPSLDEVIWRCKNSVSSDDVGPVSRIFDKSTHFNNIGRTYIFPKAGYSKFQN